MRKSEGKHVMYMNALHCEGYLLFAKGMKLPIIYIYIFIHLRRHSHQLTKPRRIVLTEVVRFRSIWYSP